jgi:hypothetical protein
MAAIAILFLLPPLKEAGVLLMRTLQDPRLHIQVMVVVMVAIPTVALRVLALAVTLGRAVKETAAMALEVAAAEAGITVLVAEPVAVALAYLDRAQVERGVQIYPADPRELQHREVVGVAAELLEQVVQMERVDCMVEAAGRR